MSKRWHYFGDMRLTEGGVYWREDGADDYVCAVDVTPCSNAGWSWYRSGQWIAKDSAGLFLP